MLAFVGNGTLRGCGLRMYMPSAERWTDARVYGTTAESSTMPPLSDASTFESQVFSHESTSILGRVSRVNFTPVPMYDRHSTPGSRLTIRPPRQTHPQPFPIIVPLVVDSELHTQGVPHTAHTRSVLLVVCRTYRKLSPRTESCCVALSDLSIYVPVDNRGLRE